MLHYLLILLACVKHSMLSKQDGLGCEDNPK